MGGPSAPQLPAAGHLAVPVSQPVARLVAGSAAGDTVLQVDDSAGFSVGDEIEISGLGASERRIVLGFGTIFVDRPLENNYPTSSTVTRTRGAEELRQLVQQGAISMDAKTRDAIIGGVVGGSVGVAGLVAGLAAGLTAHGKTSAIATLTTTLTSPPAWATLTSTTQGAVVLLGDAAARPRQALDVRAVSASGPSAAPAAALEPGQLPWTWLGIGAALVVVLSCVLLCCLRRKGLAGSAQGRCRKQARSRAVAPLSPEGASHRSSPGPPAPPPPGLGQEGLDDGRAGEARQQSTGREDSRGGARKAWDRLFEILDHDGDGRITQEDFARAPIAAVAVASALEGRQPLAARPAAAAPWQQQSFGSSQPHQQSFGSVAPAPHWQGWPAPGPGRPPAQLAVPAHAGAPRPPPRGAGMPAGPFGAPSGVGPAPRHAGAPTSPRRAGFRN